MSARNAGKPGCSAPKPKQPAQATPRGQMYLWRSMNFEPGLQTYIDAYGRQYFHDADIGGLRRR